MNDPAVVAIAPPREDDRTRFVVSCTLCGHVSRDFVRSDAAERALMRHRRSFWHRLAVGEGQSPKAIISGLMR